MLFGHDHLGWTLGAITGKIVSGIISGEKTNMNLSPYSSKIQLGVFVKKLFSLFAFSASNIVVGREILLLENLQHFLKFLH